MLAFSTVEGAVSWLRLYSAEASLDELLAGLQIVRASTALGSKDVLVRIPAISLHTADRAARLCRLLGGEVYTGSAKYFVRFRDDRSPYGYDAAELNPAPNDIDTVLIGSDFAQNYKHLSDLPFDRLLFRLSLRRVPGGDRLQESDRDELILVVERGLAEGIIRYFWRNRVNARTGLFRAASQSAFDEGRSERGFMLFSVRALPERMLQLFLGTPGVDVFRPRGSHCAVAIGYQHPFDLTSCASAFAADKYHLFWPNDRIDVLPGPLELVDIADLTKLDLQLDKANEIASGERLDPGTIAVNFELVKSPAPSARIVATLIPNQQRAHFKRLLFMLPPALLRGQRVAITDRGILVVGETSGKPSEGSGVVPLGRPLRAVAPGLLAPVECEIVPRVSPDVLARAIGHTAGIITVLLDHDPSFRLSESELLPLERRAVATIEIEAAEVTTAALEMFSAPKVVNDPVGRFSLWGFPDLDNRKALPAKGESKGED